MLVRCGATGRREEEKEESKDDEEENTDEEEKCSYFREYHICPHCRWRFAHNGGFMKHIKSRPCGINPDPLMTRLLAKKIEEGRRRQKLL